MEDCKQRKKKIIKHDMLSTHLITHVQSVSNHASGVQSDEVFFFSLSPCHLAISSHLPPITTLIDHVLLWLQGANFIVFHMITYGLCPVFKFK